MTDHKNLAYIWSAKRLNSRQARWALLFTRLNFINCQGSHNKKPDALSQRHDQAVDKTTMEAILPGHCIVGTLRWEIEQRITEAFKETSVPEDCPEGNLFVPKAFRSEVLWWGHASKLACHLGVNCTFAMIDRHFWWPDLKRVLCLGLLSLCLRQNLPTTYGWVAPAVSCPISSLVAYFLVFYYETFCVSREVSHTYHNGPLCGSHQAAIVIADRSLLIGHVFRLHCIPRDIVSDCGPQLISHVRKRFYRAMGAIASLSSGDHPQSNGQSERVSKDLETALRCVCLHQPATWSRKLLWVENTHNTLVHLPFMPAYQPPMFPYQEGQVDVLPMLLTT